MISCVLHPVQTQAVTYIIQRLASLTALLYLTGLLLFVVARSFATPEESLRNTSGVSLTESRSKGTWFGGPPLVERGSPLVENAVVQPGRPLTLETESISRKEYALTQINVVRTCLRLLILPINQNLDYDYPITHSLLEARTLGSALLLLAVFGLGVFWVGIFGIVLLFTSATWARNQVWESEIRLWSDVTQTSSGIRQGA